MTMKIKMKIKKVRGAKQQIVANQILVSNIKDTMNYLEPELCNEEILAKLVMVLTPMADTDLLNSLNELLNSFGENKLQEVKELYELFFNENPTPNNN